LGEKKKKKPLKLYVYFRLNGHKKQKKKKRKKKKGDRAQKGGKEVKDSLYIFESYSVSLFPSFLVGW
jgi:hypothetical protein